MSDTVLFDGVLVALFAGLMIFELATGWMPSLRSKYGVLLGNRRDAPIMWWIAWSVQGVFLLAITHSLADSLGNRWWLAWP